MKKKNSTKIELGTQVLGEVDRFKIAVVEDPEDEVYITQVVYSLAAYIMNDEPEAYFF